MRLPVFAILFCHSILNVQAQFFRMDAPSLDTIERYIANQKAAENMVGLSVGIIRNGEIVYLDGHGFQDSANQIDATENTMYRLASVSKTVTGLMAMRLVEENKLDLNKDIRDYVPEYPVKPEGIITSEELLSNESGVIHYSGTGSGQYCQDNYDKTARDNYINAHASTYDPIAAMDIFKNQKICYKPGEHYQYTTWGFCLMGAVLERASGQSYADLLEREIVCPLDLPSLQIELQSERPYPNESKGYDFDGNNNIIPTPTTYTDYKDVSYKTPGGGLISSVVDLTMLIQGIVNRELIADSTVKLFGTRHIPNDGKMSYYGYGTSTNFRNGDTLFWHSGSQAKTATIIYYSPENKNGLAIMCNTYSVSLFPLARLIYDYLPNVQIEGSAFIPPVASIPECGQNSIASEAKNSGFRIYPNPNDGSFTIEISNQLDKLEGVKVLDLRGKVVHQQSNLTEGANQLDLALNPGMYVVEFISSNSKSMQRIIVQ